MYAPQTHNYAETSAYNQMKVYYYHVERDFFTDKIAWLDQNAKIDRVIVDSEKTAQEIDAVFTKIYGQARTMMYSI
jgi:hypothetical protein